MTAQIRVAIADDQELLRASFRLLLEAQEDICVVGEAADGASIVELVASTRPDVVLMDARMPGMDGIEATRRLCESGDRPKVVVLTMFDADDYLYGALRAGASGFLLKNSPPEDLLRAVRVVHEGNALLAPEVTRRLISSLHQVAQAASRSDPRLATLTAREHETLSLVARGKSNDEIAIELFLTHATVRTYVSRILTKTGARDRAQLVVLAYEARLVTP
ncbi:MAG: DNA-binding response regulator [Candidatus Lumbricidophila eiseniae]|uniref:DNA-binding response regulator n=1 Tax=Candidatus Lumbricidiphila eiseniae TaxID=1969409 RepID=A0A2A6FUI5_9MICO|nr:MAG: DNA-binding response regulator [Candidatus Lumbricidophila eiseniae]